LYQFENQESRIANLFQVINARNVGVIQRSEDLGFALKSSDALRLLRARLGQRLDGDVPLQPRVACAIYLAHSADAKHTGNFVSSNASTWFESQAASFRGDRFAIKRPSL